MTSDKQLEANRQNALQSTGPNTAGGVEAIKLNALRHGLRSVQTVVPGEDPDAWEAHRAAVVDDVKPVGALELALAEQVAIKLWRLGRVVRFEADMIGNAQDPDEVAHTHEKRHTRSYGGPSRTDIPTRKDVQGAKQEAEKVKEKTADYEAALETLEALSGMKDEDIIEDWSIYEPLKQDLRLEEKELEKLFKDEDEPFAARHVRTILKKRGTVDEVGTAVIALWRDKKIPELQAKAAKAEKGYKALWRRYKAALERRRLSRGLPDDAALDKIQRYEAHLRARTSQSPGTPPDPPGRPRSEPHDYQPGGCPRGLPRARNGFVRQFCNRGRWEVIRSLPRCRSRPQMVERPFLSEIGLRRARTIPERSHRDAPPGGDRGSICWDLKSADRSRPRAHFLMHFLPRGGRAIAIEIVGPTLPSIPQLATI